jgi:hypothetical protein
MLQDGDKAVVSISTEEFGSHAVLIDKIENSKVIIRDPLPKDVGSSYSVSLEDFDRIFKKKAVITPLVLVCNEYLPTGLGNTKRLQRV